MLIRKLLTFKLSLSLFLVAWMLFGGALFWKGWTPVLFWVSLAVTGACALAALKRGCRPALLFPALAIALAAMLSLAGNLDLLARGDGWVLVGLFGLAALIAGAGIGEDRLIHSLYWAGWIWLIAWPVPRLWGWVDNRNLLGVWPVVAILMILSHKKPWWWALPYMTVLLWLGSRGALLGLGVGLLAWYRPRLNLRQVALLAAAGLSFLWALAALRPEHALNRVVYWEQASRALGEHSVWLGLGPGGIDVRNAIQEPGKPEGVEGSYQPHAHNLLLQILVELGLVGGLALVAASLGVMVARIRGRWQIAILAALLTHSLVDLPLYFPGPLVVFMAVAGTVGGKAPAWNLGYLPRWLGSLIPVAQFSRLAGSLQGASRGIASSVYFFSRLKLRLWGYPIEGQWVERSTLPDLSSQGSGAKASPRLRLSHQWITLYNRSRFL